MTGPTRRARITRAVTAHAAPTARVARASAANRKERAGVQGASIPPLVHVRIVVRRSLESRHHAGHLVCGGARLGRWPLPGSLIGATGATRAQRRYRPRRGVPVKAEDKPSRPSSKVSSSWGEISRPKTRHAEHRLPSSNRGGRSGLHHRARTGLCAGRARSTARCGGRACQRREVSRRVSQPSTKAQSSRAAAGSEPMLAMPSAMSSSEVARVKNEGVCEVPSARTQGFSQGATRPRRCRP